LAVDESLTERPSITNSLASSKIGLVVRVRSCSCSKNEYLTVLNRSFLSAFDNLLSFNLSRDSLWITETFFAHSALIFPRSSRALKASSSAFVSSAFLASSALPSSSLSFYLASFSASVSMLQSREGSSSGRRGNFSL